MVLDIPLNDSHRAYVNAVAAALTAAGITVTEVDFFDDTHPDADADRRGGARIDVATTAATRAGRELWVAYSEDTGWTLWVHDPASNRVESSHPLCAEPLPTPAEVGAAAAATLRVGRRRAGITPKKPISHGSGSVGAPSMVLDIAMNDSHRAYVNAVAAALTAAGIPIVDVDFLDDVFDDGNPLRGALTVIDAARTAATYPDRMVWAEWDERDGWDLTVYDPDTKLVVCTHTLCTEVLPTPADVAAATLAVLAAHPSTSTKLERPILSEWDEDRERGLDAYTRAAQEGTAAQGATP